MFPVEEHKRPGVVFAIAFGHGVDLTLQGFAHDLERDRCLALIHLGEQEVGFAEAIVGAFPDSVIERVFSAELLQTVIFFVFVAPATSLDVRGHWQGHLGLHYAVNCAIVRQIIDYGADFIVLEGELPDITSGRESAGQSEKQELIETYLHAYLSVSY